MVGRHLGSIRLEPHHGVGGVRIEADGGTEVGLGLVRLHLRHQQGELLHHLLHNSSYIVSSLGLCTGNVRLGGRIRQNYRKYSGLEVEIYEK